MFKYSYIFWYSTEELEEDREPLTVCHPSQLLLAKHHVVVPHVEYGKKFKAKKLHIRPPAKMFGVWMTFADYAKRPLLKWRISLIDLENPWTGFPNSNTTGIQVKVWAIAQGSSEATQHSVWYFPLLDEGKDVKICHKELLWNTDDNGPKPDQAGFWPIDVEFETLVVPFYLFAFGRSATYYSQDQATHMPAPSDHSKGYFLFVKTNQSPAWRGIEGGFPKLKNDTFFMSYPTVRTIAAQGPWVEKSIPSYGVNSTMSYKFYFQWGGTPGIQLPPTVPNAGGPPQPLASTLRWGNTLRADIVDPTTVSEEVLYPEDFDETGILSNRALERITKSPIRTGYGKAGTLGCLRGAAIYNEKKRKRSYSESEEEGTSEERCSSETEERDPGMARLRNLRRKRHRMEQLVRKLLRLNTGGTETHGSTHLSGREKSHSI